MAFEEVPTDLPGNDDNEARFIVSVTEMVSRVFSLWIRRLAHYIMITGFILALFYAASALIVWVIIGPQNIDLANVIANDPLSTLLQLSSALTSSQTIVLVALSIFGMIISNIAYAASIKLSYDDYGNPGAGTPEESLSTAITRIGKIIGVVIITALIMVPFVLPFILIGLYITSIMPASPYDPAFFTVMEQMFSLIVLAIIILLIGFYVMIRLYPALTIAVVEDRDIINSVKYAFKITGGQFWHVFFGYLLVSLAYGIIALVINLLIVSFVLDRMVLTVIGTLISTLLFTSIIPIFQTVLYKDLKVRYKVKTTQEFW